MPERPAEHVVTTHRRLWPSRSRIGLRNGQAGFGHTKFSGGFGRFSLPVGLRRPGTWAIVAGGGGNVTSSQKPQENTADENGHSGRVWLRLSASEALEHVLREGAETCDVLGLPRGGVSTRDKGLSTLTRCGLGVRCGPSALAVPDVRGRVGLRQGHDRICLICREEDSPRELSILGCDNVPDYGNE